MPRSITNKIVVSPERFAEIKEELKNLQDLKNKILETYVLPLSDVVDILVCSWLILDISDFHLEPKEDKALIRVRIDGILHPVGDITLKTYKSLLMRIKLLSGLKLNIRDRAQDGRFTAKIGDKEIELRVSALPSEFGESLVIRILDPTNLRSLKELGLRKEHLQTVLKNIYKPEGMILTVGPTGSGKTTTLYAVLKEINSPEIKIITIEDPIEYHLEGISQTQVDPKKGYDFANGLRAIVRQDPDVILVGEIRDPETANIAVQASLTGHLLLSTLHTQEVATTIWRLHSLDVSLSDLSSALRLIIAQRLVRRVCSKCSQERELTLEERKEIEKELQAHKIKVKKEQKVPVAKGCAECNFTGYKGRIGVYELIENNEAVQEKILQKIPILKFKRFLMEELGMLTLKGDAYLKVLEGITTLEEVKRVIG